MTTSLSELGSQQAIEVKAAGGSSRGSDLWLEPRQVFGGDQLARLMLRARDKHYFEVPVPVAEYDSAPTTVDLDVPSGAIDP